MNYTIKRRPKYNAKLKVTYLHNFEIIEVNIRIIYLLNRYNLLL